MRHLAYDIQRCRDDECPRKRECMRFLSRDVVGPRTSFVATCFNGKDRPMFRQSVVSDIFGEDGGNA